MKDIAATVVNNESVSSNYKRLTMRCPGLEESSPGQFVQLLCRLPGSQSPFLRRPMSIMDRRDQDIDIVYKVIGPGTQYLGQLKADDTLQVLGPLGHGFSKMGESGQGVLIIAGGTGLGGVVLLARDLEQRGVRYRLLYGVRHRHEVAKPILDTLKGELDVVVQDEEGFVTDAGFERTDFSAFSEVAICGPTPMMRACAAKLDGSLTKVELSLEEMMGCGFGICYTCPVKRKDGQGYYGACYDGPVFARELIELD